MKKKSRSELVEEYNETLDFLKDFNHEETSSVKLNTKKTRFLGDTAGAFYLKPPAIVEVWDKPTIHCAIQMAQEMSNGKLCVLNMASHIRPGGGVKNGSAAQEENLFRNTNLSTTLHELHYPLSNDEFMYSQNVKIVRDQYGHFLDDFVNVDVISVAAPFNPEKVDHEYITLCSRKISAMLSAPYFFGCTHLLLSAWGCGAFGNDPEVISALFKSEISYIEKCYEKIVFGIINDHNSVKNNFQIFHDTLDKGKGKK